VGKSSTSLINMHSRSTASASCPPHADALTTLRPQISNENVDSEPHPPRNDCSPEEADEGQA
jgi:hypothetical protein